MAASCKSGRRCWSGVQRLRAGDRGRGSADGASGSILAARRASGRSRAAATRRPRACRAEVVGALADRRSASCGPRAGPGHPDRAAPSVPSALHHLHARLLLPRDRAPGPAARRAARASDRTGRTGRVAIAHVGADVAQQEVEVHVEHLLRIARAAAAIDLHQNAGLAGLAGPKAARAYWAQLNVQTILPVSLLLGDEVERVDRILVALDLAAWSAGRRAARC